ncbi:MAG: radical SAM protein [Bdellovibrionaceae bacterium]|nr:radical SAM protein [Bdellovibrionales bacterium]MCB9086170.1 radical SAM protein [Pseudobdellovibrionaceae bacterium]
MYKSDEVKTVHLEITTKCNATCPMCLRAVLGGKINPQLPLVELSLLDIQKIMPEPFVKQLGRIYLCGNYGDPILAQETLEVLQYFRRVNPEVRLDIFTNGSARSEHWWRQAASVVDLCRFGIDGLEDTNHIYRRGTKWPLLMRNVEAFISAGGSAHWDFIVFRHNEHQVELARSLSEEMGFKGFQVKKTGRFFCNTRSVVKDRQEVLSSTGDLEYHIEMPRNPEFVNASLAQESRIEKDHGSLRNFLEKVKIHCKVAKEKSIYVSGEGHVFPCCWTANQLYPWYRKPKTGEIWSLLGQLPKGLDDLDGRRRPISEIIDGEFFQKLIPGGWEKPTFADGKIYVCAKTCGSREFDPFKAQFH